MKYLDKSFCSRPSSKEYRDHFDRVFGRVPYEEGEAPKEPEEAPDTGKTRDERDRG
jgi:hypothetical protein